MPEPQPPSVVVIGNSFEILGSIPVAGVQRVSDHLNERRSMVILERVQIGGCERFGIGADDVAINRSEIVLVIPFNEEAAGATDLASRFIAKTSHPVRMLVGEWVVEGKVHLLPEATVERFVNMGNGEFIPVTDVTLDGPEGDRTESLVLVARRHLKLLVALPPAGRPGAPGSASLGEGGST